MCSQVNCHWKVDLKRGIEIISTVGTNWKCVNFWDADLMFIVRVSLTC